jgi:hypothetical protein
MDTNSVDAQLLYIIRGSYWVQWLTPVIPANRKWRSEDHSLRAAQAKS